MLIGTFGFEAIPFPVSSVCHIYVDFPKLLYLDLSDVILEFLMFRWAAMEKTLAEPNIHDELWIASHLEG